MRRTDGDDAGAEFNTDGHVVMWREAAFAQADGQTGFAASRITYANQLGDVVPWCGGHGGRQEETKWR